jgi:hypothetical protein
MIRKTLLKLLGSREREAFELIEEGKKEMGLAVVDLRRLIEELDKSENEIIKLKSEIKQLQEPKQPMAKAKRKYKLKNWDKLVKTRLSQEEIDKINEEVDKEIK